MLKAIVFDFDGVLGDTYQLNYDVVKQYIDPQASERDFRDFHNGNVYEETKIKFKQGDDLIFVEKQKLLFAEENLFPVEDLLSQLSRDYQLFIISSSSDENILHFLKLKHLDQYFNEILGYSTHQSKVAKFEMVFNKYEITSVNCVFVTDTVGDIKEAKKVGVPTIAVTWGFHNRELLAQHQPYAIVDNFDQLRQVILSIS